MNYDPIESTPSLLLYEKGFGMFVLVILFLICPALSKHIIELSMTCPKTLMGRPSVLIVADIDIVAYAACANGNRTFVMEDNTVRYNLAGTFDQLYTGDDCIFQEDDLKRRYSVNVAIGWGEGHIITLKDLKTATCNYDENGDVLSTRGIITTWVRAVNGTGNQTGVTGATTITFMFVEKDGPIVQLGHDCPDTPAGQPIIELTTDVPAYGMALCRNGNKVLIPHSNDVKHRLGGSLDQSYNGELCLFYKKKGSNTYTVDVEVGWGEVSGIIINQKNIFTLSCAYDDHGRSVSPKKTISSWFLTPEEKQYLLGTYSVNTTFILEVVDVLGKPVNGYHIALGRKIRLKATETTDIHPGFRVLSCEARNPVTNYVILRAGCGDGLVLEKKSGFTTDGPVAYSPYFNAFKLQGAETIEFNCNFTICETSCNGDSCEVLT